MNDMKYEKRMNIFSLFIITAAINTKQCQEMNKMVVIYCTCLMLLLVGHMYPIAFQTKWYD